MLKKTVLLLMLSTSSLIYSKELKKNEDNLYRNTNTQVQMAMNKLFLLLRAKHNMFTMDDKNRLLLSVHAGLKSVAERNYLIYNGVRKLCQLNVRKKPRNGLFNLDKLIQVLIEEKLTPTIDNNKKPSKRAGGGNIRITSLEIPDKMEESLIFLREYLNNVEGVELPGFDTPFQMIKSIYEKNKMTSGKKKQLKAWRTQNSTEGRHLETRRVFQGKRVRVRKFPFMASIHLMGEFVCSGSIISTEMVITAANCLLIVHQNPTFLKQNPEGISVRLGSDYTQRFGDVVLARKVFIHPGFNPDTLKHNLAIIKLERRLRFWKRNKKMRRIEYQRIEGKLPDNIKEVVMLGWGDKEPEKTSVYDPLAYAHLGLYNTSQCVDTYSSKYVTESNFCAGFSDIGSGACHHDVGGPAIVSSVLVGVVSFGPPVCGTPDAPTVFTNIGYYVSWIDNILNGITSQTPPVNLTPVMPSVRAKFSTNVTPSMKKKHLHPYVSIPNYKFNIDMVPRPFFINQSAVKTESATTQPFRLRSEYPRAIQMLTYLLDEIITGDEKKGSSHFMSDSSDIDSDSDSSQADNKDDNRKKKATTEPKVPSKPVLRLNVTTTKYPDFVSIFHEFVKYSAEPAFKPDRENKYNIEPEFKPNRDNNFGRTNPSFTFSPILTTDPDIVEQVSTKDMIQPTNSNKTNDPIKSALQALRLYLGLDALGQQMTSEEKLDRIIKEYIGKTTTEPNKITRGRIEEPEKTMEDELLSESNDYESDEKGLSIEIPTGVSFFTTPQHSSTKHHVTPEVFSNNRDFKIQPFERNSDIINYKAAEEMLHKNFVLNESIPNSKDLNSDELVVLVLQDRNINSGNNNRKRKGRGSLFTSTKIAEFKSIPRTNTEFEDIRYPLREEDVAYQLIDSNENYNEDNIYNNDKSRRRLLDYIITN